MESNTDELNILKQQIKETKKLLETNSVNQDNLDKLKTHRLILGIVSILLLGALVWSILFKIKNSNVHLKEENLVLVNKDSLSIYKNNYSIIKKTAKSSTDHPTTNLDTKKIVYSVQVGAIGNFKLTSFGKLSLLKNQFEDYTKFSVGSYDTYVKATILKDSLKKIGFKDCFLTAKSFGKPIDIKKALYLSKETQYLYE